MGTALASPMRYFTHSPGPPLAGFVDCIWHYDRGTAASKPMATKERLLPTGTVEIIFNLGEDETRYWDRDDPSQCTRGSASTVCGVQTSYFIIDTQEQDCVVGVHFHPGGAYPFLGVDAHELADRHVDLDQLWGQEAGKLRERLLDQVTPQARITLIEEALVQHAFRPFARHPAVAGALERATRGGLEPRIDELTRESQLSAKRFIERFAREVGLTPKRFCRVLRFQRVLDQLESVAADRRLDWIEIALASGYADQSHFIREFKGFTGLTPSAYAASVSSRRNHVELAE